MTTDGKTPAESVDWTSHALGDIDPNGSRQLGRRSAVCWRSGSVVAGLHDGTVVCVDADGTEERWRYAGVDGSVVSLAPFGSGILAGTRGRNGDIFFLDSETGDPQWRYVTANDIGDPQNETRFFQPFVVDIATADDTAYVVARRYERGVDGGRNFQAVIYAFESDGVCRWRRDTDASPVAVDVHHNRLGVAFNRCPGDDTAGLCVFDAEDGTVHRRWNPPGDGQRRVGDLSLVDDGVVITSHADYRGYMLDDDGVRWRIDLGCPVEQSGETVYTYPNHVHATDRGVVFLTGNTYPADGRETEARHPAEQTATAVTPAGDRQWATTVGGFAHEIATDGDRVVVPVAQHFRDRDPSIHGILALDVTAGQRRRHRTAGVTTAAACGDGIAAIEEPVAYHDTEAVAGEYRLHVRN